MNDELHEEIIEIIENECRPKDVLSWFPGGVIVNLKRAIEKHTPPSGWVKTSDRLPTKDDANERGYVFSLKDGVGNSHHLDHIRCYPLDYTAWCPRPKDLQAEEKPGLCPWCKNPFSILKDSFGQYIFTCQQDKCTVKVVSSAYSTRAEAISASKARAK